VTVNRSLRCLLILFLSTHPLRAKALENIVRPYQSARAAGMGGIIYTTGIYEENFFANPARAAFNPKWRVDIVSQLFEANTGLIENIDKISGSGNTIENIAATQGKNNHLRVQTILPALYFPHIFSSRSSIAIGLMQSTQVDAILRRNLTVDPVMIADVGPAVTYARRFFKDERLALGVTAHWTYRVSTKETFSTTDYIKYNQFKVSESGSEGAHYDFDLGSHYVIPGRPRDWQISLSGAVNNILGGKYKNANADFIKQVGGPPRSQPTSYNFGTSAQRYSCLHLLQSCVFAFEVQNLGNNRNGSIFRTLHMGTELKPWGFLAIRGGVSQGYLSAGLGLDFPLLDLEFATYGEEMSLNVGGKEDRRYVARIGLSI